jgi:arabinan endo-1,5-alpha-L-arabinosidase
LVLRSTANDDYNAIDPNFVVDAQGRSWLDFGSFWTGIKMRRLNDEGKVLTEDTELYSLATRHQPSDATPAKPGLPPDWEAIEAPFIVRHDGYYYLFVSWDLCCKGIKSTYHIVTGRAKEITGPYVDENGTPMMQGGGTELLKANEEWLGPGGQSILLGSPADVIAFHAYDAKTGTPALQISTIDWSGGWPHIALEAHHGPAPQRQPRSPGQF